MVKLTRIEKAQQKQKLRTARELENCFAADGKKGRRPSSKAPKKGAKGGAQLSDHGVDLHYGQNNNGFPTARVNSQEPRVDDYGVADRFDYDGVPELDAETVAGRGRVRPTMKPLYRPRGEGEESDEEGGSDKDDDVKEIYNNMSTAERERCRESILRHRAERRSASEEKAANKAAMAKYFSETAVGLDESGLGARGAAAPSRGNASRGGPSRGNSSGGGAIGGNASGGAARGGSRDLQEPPSRGSNASLRHSLRHVPGEEPANEDSAAGSEDDNARLAVVLRRGGKRKSKCLLLCCCRPLP
jgi:hypothetical protein